MTHDDCAMFATLNEHRQLAAGAAAALAVFFYGVGYFALAAYYDTFGISPADAGITQSALVARTVAGFSFFFGFALAIPSAAWLTYRAVRLAKQAAWARRTAFCIAVALLVVGARFTTFGWTTAAVAIGFGVMLGLWVFRLTKGQRDNLRLLAPGVAALVVAVIGWVFFIEVTSASERLGTKVRRDGTVRDASPWEAITRYALGISAVPAEVPGDACAVLLAYSGDDAWVLKSSGDIVAASRVDRKDVVVRYSVVPTDAKRSCWRQHP